jgi:hypothetical protein
MNEMNKFEIGDRVRVEKKGKEGVVVDYFCDYVVGDHQVQVQLDGERIALSYGEENVTYVGPDKYEYGVLQTRVSSGEDLVDRLVWGTLKEAQDDFGLMNRPSAVPVFTYRIVKRRKAGNIEDV